MEWSLEQLQRINDLQNWYLDKTNKVIESLDNNKINLITYWDDCRKLIKSVRSNKQLREWQIVFENMENIINNKYEEV